MNQVLPRPPADAIPIAAPSALMGDGKRASIPPDLAAALRRSPVAQAVLITAAFLLLRGLSAGLVGLGVDESYTLSVSRRLALSYFDHPPLHQWIALAAGRLLGWGRAARAPFVAMSGVTSLLMFVLSRRLFGPAAAVWATLALNLSGFFTAVAGAWILPDGPLDLFLLAAAVAVAELVFPSQPLNRPLGRRAIWTCWLSLGLCLGLAGLSKYQAVLFAAGLLLFFASSPDLRRWFRHPAPWAGAALCLLVVSPVLVWNAGHGWASLLFQSGRGAPRQGLHPLDSVAALAGAAAVLLPWVFAPLAGAAWSALRRGPSARRHWLCLMLAAPAIALFTVAPLWSGPGLPHWSMCGWLLLFPLLGDLLARQAARGWPRAWVAGSLAALVLLWPFAVAEAATGFLHQALPRVFRVDPTVEAVQWRGLKAQVARRLGSPSACLFVAAASWVDAGKIGQGVGDLAPVHVFSADPRGFAFLGPPAAPGCDALIIGPTAKV
ncbi:MAG: hypothetical protein JWP50_20, partial [Phenylobacterium sp.]|nr:hypothetical protein [Phenylobacterium sp.]